ncbi:MAG TPA: hypothetical protein PKN32_14785 [Bacteroidales bacterium]|jgi:hypothetical protein|nr:hypothetical protein [Bacteroidales bacterium]
MTNKDRKLAEDTIKNFIQDDYLPRHRMILGVDEIIELMQAYHKAKTDQTRTSFKESLRDSEIKHTEK